jgi:L,D-transpeptidase ErfK/SrfK
MIRFIIAICFTLITALLSFPVFAKPYGAKICSQPDYTCYKVKRGDSWQKLFPDADQRDVVMRINRMNTSLYRGLTIAIPVKESNDLLAHAPFSTHINPPGHKVILVSLQRLAFGAYNADGNLVHWGPISSAKGYCPDIGRHCRTSTGHFQVLYKKGKGCTSSRYPVGKGGAPMPYCMFFNGNFALHGSYDVPGYNASHGCIRLFISDAKWLNQEFTSSGGRTSVIVQ